MNRAIMEKKNTSVWYNGMVWGLILGFVSIIFSVIMYMMDQFANQNLNYISLAISIVIMIFAYRSFRDQIRGGVMPFGTALGFGVVAFVVASLLSSIYSYLMVAVIDPELLVKIKDAALEQAMEKSRGAPPEAVEQGFEMMSFMFKPLWMAIMGLFSGAFMGTIAALILSAIFKRDEDPEALLAEAAEADESPAE
jgi:hypothetical protein